jgi:hypothetical protein
MDRDGRERERERERDLVELHPAFNSGHCNTVDDLCGFGVGLGHF